MSKPELLHLGSSGSKSHVGPSKLGALIGPVGGGLCGEGTASRKQEVWA